MSHQLLIWFPRENLCSFIHRASVDTSLAILRINSSWYWSRFVSELFENVTEDDDLFETVLLVCNILNRRWGLWGRYSDYMMHWFYCGKHIPCERAAPVWYNTIPVVVQRQIASCWGRWRHSLAGWYNVRWRHRCCRKTTLCAMPHCRPTTNI